MMKAFCMLMVIGLISVGVIFGPTNTYALETHEDLMETALSLYGISGDIMKDTKRISTLPVSEKYMYAYSKSRVDLSISIFEGISVVLGMYDKSSGCKIKIARTVVDFSLLSLAKAEYIVRQLKITYEEAESLGLLDLKNNLGLSIEEAEKGLETLKNFTYFMDKDLKGQIGKLGD